ncbi:MAG: right-handed parallel beta-helix repeat-containing protein [Myxococcota bacterium]
MNKSQRTLALLALPALCTTLVPGCPFGDLPQSSTDTDDAATDGTGDPNSTEGADSTGVPGDCAPLGPDDVNTDTTLPAGCYWVSTFLTVEHRLDLEPGVELVFDPIAGLAVVGTGTMSAQGTDQAPILMTPSSDQGWLGLQWIGSTSSDNRLEHVRLEAPADIGIELTAASRLTVSDCEIVDAPGVGLHADPGAQLTVSATTFEGGGVPLLVGIDAVAGIASDNTFTSNAEPFVQVAGGTLSGDAQWAALGIPLRLTGNAYVESALTLSPGLTIEMAQDSEFVVRTAGSINAEGTADDPITMRGVQDERGYWRGLSVESKASANIMRHCAIEHGGARGWNGSDESVATVWLPDQSKLVMSDCALRRGDGAALTSFGGADISGFANNTIEDNRQTIKVAPQMVGAIEASNTFVDNDEAYVRVGRPNANNEAIVTPATWPALGVPYRVMDRFYVETDWTIEPGATVEVMQDRQIIIEVGGSLHAVGTAQDPITLTGAESLPGYWKGLQVLSVSADNELQHVVLSYGGSSGFNGNQDSDGGLFVEGTIRVSDSEISESGGHGVVVWDDAQLMGCAGMSFTNNAKLDVWVHAQGLSACS